MPDEKDPGREALARRGPSVPRRKIKVGYGVTRKGRFPVLPTMSSPDLGGYYVNEAPNALELLPLILSGVVPLSSHTSDFFGPTSAPKGKITINENAEGDPRDVLKHELVHGLLETSKFPYKRMAGKRFGMSTLFSGLDPSAEVGKALRKDRRGGDPLTEAPAYSVAYEPDITPNLTPEMRRDYLKRLYDVLATSKAKHVLPQIQQLAGPIE